MKYNLVKVLVVIARDEAISHFFATNFYPVEELMMEKGGFIYMLTNKSNTTLYIGVTSGLISRVFKHKEKV